MVTYLAKPNAMNSFGAKSFTDMFAARDYLNEVTETEIKIPVDEWIILDKLYEVKYDGKLVKPEKFPKIKKGKLVWVKFNERKFL
jgi:hypothetical protein